MPSVPLQLWNRPHWELKGDPHAGPFFARLRAAFPAATHLFIEGAGIARDVDQFLRSAAQPGDYLPARQTIWPRPKQYRLACTDQNLDALAALAERHAEPELMDHLFVYAGPAALLEYPDAFGGRSCPLCVSADADEQAVRNFAAVLGLEVLRVGFADIIGAEHDGNEN